MYNSGQKGGFFMTHYSHYSTLDDDGRDRLTRVLKMAAGNLAEIPKAVNKALAGVSEKGRWLYLRNELTRRAKRHIRDQNRARAGKKSSSEMVFTITPAIRLDARNHQEALFNGIPEEDR